MLRRMYHVSCVSYSIKKLGVKLNKMMNPKNKRTWYPSQSFEMNSLPSVKSLTKIERQPGKQGIRRVAMLNKLFMKQIADLMSTGTVSMDIIGRGIEISKVKISPDMNTVNVFWVCKGDLRDVEIEALLNKTAGALRHELSTLRVMGEVPYITFVKDLEETRLVELDHRLSIADYGDDYTPTEAGHLLKSQFTLNTKLSPELKAKIKQLDDDSPVQEEPIPEMTNDVYGLDHAKIMNRILAARKRSRDAWKNFDIESPVISYRAPTNKHLEVNTEDQKQELAEFLLKRQILQNKLHKELLDSRNGLQMADDDIRDDDDEADNHNYIDDDYYEEDDYSDDEIQNGEDEQHK